MTIAMPAPRTRRRLDRDVVRIIAALTGILIAILAILAWLYVGIPEDWRSQGLAACLFKDASGAMQMECRP